MKKIKLLSVLFLLGSVLLISSCKKDDDPTISKTLLLTQNSWKYSAATTADALSQSIIDAFYKDSEYTFKTDKTYSALFLTIPNSGKWEFSSDEKKLILDKGTSSEETFEIAKLDAAALEISQVISGVTTTYKYVKK